MTEHPSRRSILSALASIPCIAAPVAFVAIDGADAALVRLGRDLDRTHAARLAFERLDTNDEDPGYEPHWQLREQINAIEAAGPAGLRAKARAAELALHYDPDAECQMSGSFFALARSLVADVRRLTA